MPVQDIRINLRADTTDIRGAKKDLASLVTEEDKIEDGFKKINREASKTGDVLKGQLGGVANIAKGVGAAILAGFALDSVVSFGKKVIEITAQFQKLQSVLNNTLGKTGGQQAFSLIQQFAAETNFSVLEVTESFVKLANQGFTPTKNQLRQLADLANATGKGFDQLAEAIIDAQTGEFERLKEFGIRASKQGDQVKFTFKGVETQVKNTTGEITKYITSLGDLEGVSGSTAAISATLEGQISNLGDSFDNLFNVVGSSSTGILTTAISLLKSLVDEVAFSLKSLEQIRKEDSLTLAGETLQTYKEFTPALREALYANLLAQEENFQDEIKLSEKRIAYLQTVIETSSSLQARQTALFNQNEEKKRQDDLSRTLQYTTAKLDAIDDYNTKEAESAAKSTTVQLGLLESLRKKLKELRELQEKSGSEEGIAAYGKQAEEVELKIKNLLEGLKPKEFFSDISEIARNSMVEIDDMQRYLFDESAKAAEERLKNLVDTSATANASIIYNEEETAARIEEIRQRSYQLGMDLANAFFDLSANRREQQLADIQAKEDAALKNVGDNEQAKNFYRAKFADEERKIKQKQAQADKQQALLNIFLNAAPGIVKYTAGLPATAPLLALLAATTALQAGLVAARPIPKFATGTEYLNGKAGTDTNLIWADTGERIIDKNTNRQLRGVSNKELPKLVQLGKLVTSNTYNNDPRIVSELVMLRKSFEGQPREVTQLDERSLRKFTYHSNMKKEKLNQRFSWG